MNSERDEGYGDVFYPFPKRSMLFLGYAFFVAGFFGEVDIKGVEDDVV
ncbi:hypothetical protein G6554_23060 [Bacillus sp. MM2020_4]|nr:hypothetical protein [Bacillus sp. MM2020_4]